MRHLPFLIVSIILLAHSCKTVQPAQKSEQPAYFTVEVIQNGKVVPEKNNVIQLKKAPFKFEFRLYKTNSVFVSPSWGTYYYGYPDDQNIFKCEDDSYFEDCRFVSIKTGAEDDFNEDKDIAVGNEDYQFVWFYKEDMDWYRFDKGVTVKDGVIHATMTVENIYDCDLRDSGKVPESEFNYPIEKIDKDIYMVIATEHYESGMEHPKEMQREKFILKFK